MARRVAMAASGAATYALGVYASYRYFARPSDTADADDGAGSCACSLCATPSSFLAAEAPRVWSNNAARYDASIGWDELLMGVPLLRRWLLYQGVPPSASVLEVCGGTGRNLSAYPARTRRVVVSDRSEPMLAIARKKASESTPAYDIAFAVANADDVKELQRHGPFDAVVDTFGLCSVPDPQAALAAWSRIVHPEHGRILLLEHGRSTWQWINDRLDREMARHLRLWGCVWNRDIAAIVADSPHVELESMQRFHFGTTYLVVARPKPRAAEQPSSQ